MYVCMQYTLHAFKCIYIYNIYITRTTKIITPALLPDVGPVRLRLFLRLTLGMVVELLEF